MLCIRSKEKIKWPYIVINEQVVNRIGEKRTLLNYMLRRKPIGLAKKKLPSS